MMERSISHESFTIERTCNVSLKTCWAAWSNPELKAKWFAEGDGDDFIKLDYGLDFRVGGREHGEWKRISTGVVHANETTIMDIVERERIIVAYTMIAGDMRHSASLATITFAETGGQTTIKYVEQAAFFGGVDDAGMRASGVNWQFDRLKTQLERTYEQA